MIMQSPGVMAEQFKKNAAEDTNECRVGLRLPYRYLITLLSEKYLPGKRCKLPFSAIDIN